MEELELTDRLSIAVPHELIVAIDNWRRRQENIPARARAARMLLTKALAAEGVPTVPPKAPAAAAKKKAPSPKA
jgi:hypothetical protein